VKQQVDAPRLGFWLVRWLVGYDRGLAIRDKFIEKRRTL